MDVAGINFKRHEHDKVHEGYVLAVTNAERVKKPKLPKKRLLKKTQKKHGRP
jgi:hypothetical protein